jgi:hypothetical protein
MELLVNIQIGESSVCYTVKREIDGIYIARLFNTSHYNNRNSPPKFFCIKVRMDGNQTIMTSKLGYVLAGK